MHLYRVYTWRRGTGEGVPGRRISEERRWFCVPVFLFLWMGQASGSWIRVSGGKKSGKVLLSVSWGFFFPFGWEGEGEASLVDGSGFWVLEMSI